MHRCALPLTFLIIFFFGIASGSELRISDPIAHEQSAPQIAVFGQNIRVVYQDTSEYNYDIRLTYSNDGGATFSPSTPVHPKSDQVQWQPHIAAGPSGETYIVWADFKSGTDFDIYITATTDGENFTVPVRVNDIPAGSQLAPRVAVNEAGEVFVVWNDNRGTTSDYYSVVWNVAVAKSTDSGASFGPSILISEEETPGEEYFAQNADIAAAGDSVHIVWTKYHWGNHGSIRTRYTRSDDAGDTYLSPVTLDENHFTLRHQIVADQAGRVAIVWEDNRESGADPALLYGSGRTLDVYSRFSQDYGENWAPSFRVNQELLLCQQRPSVALTDSGWAVAWSDDREVGNYTIRLATESWPPSGTQLTGQKIDEYSGLVERTFPALTAFGSSIYIVWQDFRDDNYDIYFNMP